MSERTGELAPIQAPALDETHGAYRLRFARSCADVDAVKRLRFEVFHEELHEGLAANADRGIDEDAFDAQCDHLLVEDARTGQPIGTYRLQTIESAQRGKGFYSAGEFDLEPLARDVLPAAVELGRACVAASHRNKKVLFLLWRGLGAYLLAHGKRYFFGCSSLTSQDPAQGLALARRFARDGLLRTTGQVHPLPAFACDAPEAAIARARVKVPALFFTYLRYGAVLCGLPALDSAFGTIDFLTLLDCAAMELRQFGSFTQGLPWTPSWAV